MNTNKTSIDQLLNTMIATDRAGAAVLIERIIQDGMPGNRVITDILGPTLLRIGVLWGKKSVSLAQTFVAAKIAEDVLLRCMPEVGAPAPHKCPVVIGNIEDDFHSLGRHIVVTFLRAAGWEVYDLGNDVLAEEFVDKAVEVHAAVVGVSAMMQTTALNIRKVRDLIDDRGLQDRLKLAVGGAVFNWRPQLVADVGADGTAENAAGTDALLRRLQSEAKGEPQS
jgi:methylmalonyl-CoA mutase cobalamin-binding domain/chain